MNEQNNQEEEEYEEEEIEVYEEVEVDEEVEASDITSSKKKPDNKDENNIKAEISSFNNNNTNNIQDIPQNNAEINNKKEENIVNKDNNNQINNQNKDIDIIIDSNNNDNINKEVSYNIQLLEDKIKMDKNGCENDVNLKNDDTKINYMNNLDNLNNNIDNNKCNNDNNIQFNNTNNLVNINLSNNDFNFDFSNNFNFDNKNSENKYLNLEYKIIPGRESLEIFPNEMKIISNPNDTFEKKEENLIPNQSPIIEENKKDDINNNNSNINNNEQNINMPSQPQGHRSKIKRNNNKKLIQLNYSNINNNYQNNGENANILNTEINNFYKKESYFKDNENDNIQINRSNDNINNECLLSNEKPIKTSLENIITTQNDYTNNNYIFNNQESININQNLAEYFNKPEQSILNNEQNIQAQPNITINTNNINPINDNNIKIDDKEIKEINTNEQELNQNENANDINKNIDNDIENGNKEINLKNDIINENNEPKQVIEENKINNEIEKENTNINNINNEIENKKRINMKKTKEEIEYEEKLVELIGNNEIIELLESRKWEEKKKGFLKLNQYLNEKIEDKLVMENNFEKIFTFIVLKLNNFKETNFNLLKEGILCLQILISYYKGKNIPLDKKYLDKIMFGLNEKIADSKLKEVYLQLLKILIEIYSQKTVYSLLFDLLLRTNKISVLKEYAIYLRDNIKEQNSISDIDLKNMIEFIVKIANHTNPQIRSISIEIICLLYKFVGPDLKQLISGIKESTFKLIEKELEKINYDNNDNSNNNNDNNNNKNNANDKVKALLVTKNIQKRNNKDDLNLYTSSSATNNNDNMSYNNLINNKRIDISKEITPKLLKEINRGKWIEKKEGIKYINSIIDKANNKISKNGLLELFDLIKDKINDGNINLVKITLQLLNHLIVALDNQIKAFYKIMVYPLLLKLSDKSKQIRDECHSCVENWIKLQNFEIFAVYMPQLLISTENFDMRNEILTLINKNKDLIKNDFPKLFFKELTKAFLACLQDKNAIIRNSTEELIKDMSNFIPREKYIMELKDIKRSISDYLYNIIDKLLPQIDTGVPMVSEAPTDRNGNIDKEKEKDEDLKNNTTIIHHQKVSPTKKKKKYNRNDKKIEGASSIDKSNIKSSKKETSFINENKNKSILNSTINSTLFENNNNKDKDKESTKKNENNTNKEKSYAAMSTKRKNKVLSCDKVTPNKAKKLEKSKFSSVDINTEGNISRNIKKQNVLNKKNNNNVLDTSCRQDVTKRNKKARNRSMITEKNIDRNTDRNNIDNINDRTITNYGIKKEAKSLTTEKNIKDKKNINLNTTRNKNNIKINNIKEQPRKINYKKFLNNNNGSNKKNQIFLANYKIKKGMKEKRYENDKKSNFYFEVQNFDYLPKINELLKSIFAPDFISKMYSNDLKLINASLSQLKILIDESINNNNEDNYNKLIDNLDLILKVIGSKISSNQTASLIKTFFIFADTLINSYKIKNYKFNDTEINILLNIFADKLTNNNLILKETACNLIYFLNDQIDSSKTFIMLIHLFEYKNAKLKGEIIDIIIKLYEDSNFDTIIINKVLKSLIRAYFESDLNTKKKILYLLEDIYGLIGNEFWKHTKFLSSKDRDELVSNLVPENENDIYGEMDQKDTSREYNIEDLNNSNFIDYDSDNNDISNNRRDSKLDNDNNHILKFNGENNYDYDHDSLKANIQNNNITIEKRKNKLNFKRSITDNSKKEQKSAEKNNYNTNNITSNINDINSINSRKKENDAKCITERELSEALDMLINPEEDLVEAIINIHCITYRNYAQNKKVLNKKADNIINCFIEVINKLFSNKPLRIKVIKYYIVILCKLCNIKEFIINISENTQKNLIILILSNLLYEKLNTLGDNDEGMAIWRSLNSMISHIIEYCEAIRNISIIIELEQKYRKERPKLAEYSARCLVIITQNIKNTFNNIDLNIIFNNIHSILNDFIKETNDLQLKEKTDQTILITLRNLINELVKAKMDNLLDDYNKWIQKNNLSDEKYILNWINESLLRIKKIKNNDNDENTNINGNNAINDNNNNNGNNDKDNNSKLNSNDGEHIITDNKSNNLENIKKKWKDLQEKNNINNK